MEHSISKLTKTLKDQGYSLTSARKAVFNALLDSEPLTMAGLTKSVGTTIDRASIYRVVSLFEQLGIIQRLQIGWKYQLELSDEFAAHHHHMSCIKCGVITAFEESTTLEFELKQLASEAGFYETGHQLEIRGLCTNCQKS